ncbi:hypothetical protein [Ruegeria sp. HKCCD7255]|uniref:Cap15 family cyclic dinucleotide receptor domain-containing protein n=1 Tax=Ruegeria sp. HKCCD7255 TaxID=2683004 RepID=UPI0014881096|nr:hypothetical protein [Ruegeria sp. HKCCD7255]
MYALLPWKLLSTVLLIIVAVAVYVDDVFALVGVSLPENVVVRALPVVLLTAFSVFFAPTGYYAPWRILWRLVPVLNNWFPDLNGVWVGKTSTNGPTIRKLIEMAKSNQQLTEQELHDIPEQEDAMAVEITNSLFSLRIDAGLSSTNAQSHSIAAKPWRHQHTGRIHLSYVFQQETPKPAITDEETHLGAAELVLDSNGYANAEGTYWTRRSWRTGRNTAGSISLTRKNPNKRKGKSLTEFAAEHKAQSED